MKKLIVTMIATLVILALAAGCSTDTSTTTSSPPAATTTTTTQVTTTTTSMPPPPPPSSTTTPYTIEVSGTVQGLGVDYGAKKTENGKHILEGTARQALHGGLEGEMDMVFTIVIDLADMSYTRTGEATFRGTVDGKQGAFTTRDSTTGQMTGPDSGASNEVYTVVSGTGGLNDLHGVIVTNTKFDAVDMTGTYTGTLGFGIEPKITTTAPPVKTTTTPAADGTIERIEQVDDSPPVTEGNKKTSFRTVTWSVQGKLEGTWVRTGTIVGDMVTGKLNASCETTFNGTVDGKQGTFTTTDVATGQAFSPTAGLLSYESTITGSTGDLAGLSGKIFIKTSYDDKGQKGTYTCKLSFGE